MSSSAALAAEDDAAALAEYGDSSRPSPFAEAELKSLFAEYEQRLVIERGASSAEEQRQRQEELHRYERAAPAVAEQYEKLLGVLQRASALPPHERVWEAGCAMGWVDPALRDSTHASRLYISQRGLWLLARHALDVLAARDPSAAAWGAVAEEFEEMLPTIDALAPEMTSQYLRSPPRRRRRSAASTSTDVGWCGPAMPPERSAPRRRARRPSQFCGRRTRAKRRPAAALW